MLYFHETATGQGDEAAGGGGGGDVTAAPVFEYAMEMDQVRDPLDQVSAATRPPSSSFSCSSFSPSCLLVVPTFVSEFPTAPAGPFCGALCTLWAAAPP